VPFCRTDYNPQRPADTTESHDLRAAASPAPVASTDSLSGVGVGRLHSIFGAFGLKVKSKLKSNPDGTIDIYFGSKAPEGYESNWLPSAGEDFFLIFRFYGPAKSIYQKTWKMPDIERIQ
jgi:hypothetical protein